MFILLSFLTNLMFLNSNNPLMLSIFLIFQTIFISVILGKMSFSFWFSYIIFLVFIGGLLILFLYVIALIYNNKFNYMKKKYMLMLFILPLMIFMFKFMNNYESQLNMKIMFFDKENGLNLIKLYNSPNNFINMMMISYLFFMLIIVVKITNFYLGPIRSM